jgi:hypothetical protein
MVSIFRSQTTDAELDADNIHGVLESNGIWSVVERGGPYPILGYEVMVTRENEASARQLIAEALASGPEAADEGEAASEE